MEERLKKWREAGLITAERAEAISAYEALAERRRVSAREILVYIGGFFVLMAVAFGLQVKWDDLGSLSRVVVVAAPTLILWATGEALRKRGGPLLRRGAQVLWMVASWLTAILIAVMLIEWPGVEPKDEWLLLWASLGAVPLAAVALWVLPGLPQGLAVVTLASGVAMGGAMVAHLTWPEMQWAQYVPPVVVGAAGLAAAEVARRWEKGSLIWLFNLFGAWSWLLGALFIAGAVSWRANVYMMHADGSNQTRLTRQAAGDWSPTWSPDGSRIAFQSDRDGTMDIYVMDADGSNQTRLTRDPAGDWSPAWSPDGGRIAFESDRDENADIYVMDADGSNQTRLTQHPAEDWSPAWSPDGSRIAFESHRDENADIYVMDGDGSNQTRLTQGPAGDWSPAWSPDGSRIAFQSDRDGNVDIYVMDADGSNEIRLTRHAAGDSSAAWSPDGSRIVFQSDRDGNVDIYVMDADGSNEIRLTRHAAGDSSAAWSPDGNRIAFESGRAWRPSLVVWDVLLLTECLMFIVWSVGRQSRVLLYSGLFFLFVGIVQVNSHFFRGQLRLPVALLIAGIALIATGLGVHRLRWREART